MRERHQMKSGIGVFYEEGTANAKALGMEKNFVQ